MGENPVHRQLRSEANLRLGSISAQSVASDPGLSSNAGYIREAVGGRSATMSNDAWGKSVSQPVKRLSVEAGASSRPSSHGIDACMRVPVLCSAEERWRA